MKRREQMKALIMSSVDQKHALGSDLLDELLKVIADSEKLLPDDTWGMRMVAKGRAVSLLHRAVDAETVICVMVAMLDRLEKAEKQVAS